MEKIFPIRIWTWITQNKLPKNTFCLGICNLNTIFFFFLRVLLWFPLQKYGCIQVPRIIFKLPMKTFKSTNLITECGGGIHIGQYISPLKERYELYIRLWPLKKSAWRRLMSPQLEEIIYVWEFLFSCLYVQTVFLNKVPLSWKVHEFSLKKLKKYVYWYQAGNLQPKQLN